MNIYLQLEAGSGKLFEYSKTEKEGFVRHEGENPKTKVVSVSYRKYHDKGVFGKLVGASSREADFGGTKTTNLSIVMDHVNGDRIFINFPLRNQKNDIQSYAISFLSLLPHLVVGSPYKIYPYVMEGSYNGNPTKSYGVSVKHARLSDQAVDDDNKIARLTFEKADRDGNITEAGDIPRTEWIIKAGQMVANNDKRNEFLWGILTNCAIGDGVAGGSARKTFNSLTEQDALVETPVALATQPEPIIAYTQEVLSAASMSTAPTPAATIANGSGGAMQPNNTFDAAVADDDDGDLPF